MAGLTCSRPVRACNEEEEDPDSPRTWPHILVEPHLRGVLACGDCFDGCPHSNALARKPAFYCNVCKIWKAVTAGHQESASSSQESVPLICAECRLAQDTCTNCGQSIKMFERRRMDLQYQYCSEACKFPPCAGPGANGKGCKAPRPKQHGRGKPLRFDEEPDWRCTACRKRKR